MNTESIYKCDENGTAFIDPAETNGLELCGCYKLDNGPNPIGSRENPPQKCKTQKGPNNSLILPSSAFSDQCFTKASYCKKGGGTPSLNNCTKVSNTLSCCNENNVVNEPCGGSDPEDPNAAHLCNIHPGPLARCVGSTPPPHHHRHRHPSPKPLPTKWTQETYNTLVSSLRSNIQAKIKNKGTVEKKILCIAHKIANHLTPATMNGPSTKQYLIQCLDSVDLPGGKGEWNTSTKPPNGIQDLLWAHGPSPGPSPTPTPGPSPTPSPGPSPSGSDTTMSSGLIIGIIVGGVVFVGLVIAIAMHLNGMDSRGSRKKKKGKRKK